MILTIKIWNIIHILIVSFLLQFLISIQGRMINMVQNKCLLQRACFFWQKYHWKVKRKILGNERSTVVLTETILLTILGQISTNYEGIIIIFIAHKLILYTTLTNYGSSNLHWDVNLQPTRTKQFCPNLINWSPFYLILLPWPEQFSNSFSLKK